VVSDYDGGTNYKRLETKSSGIFLDEREMKLVVGLNSCSSSDFAQLTYHRYSNTVQKVTND
jgi:hypothetical protein